MSVLARLQRLDDYTTNGDGCAPVWIVDRDGYDVLSVYREYSPLRWGLDATLQLQTPETTRGFWSLQLSLQVGPFALSVQLQWPRRLRPGESEDD